MINVSFFHRDSLALILANSVPLFGVLFFDWSLFGIMFLYWLENGIIGLFNVLRMHYSQKPLDSRTTVSVGNKTYRPKNMKGIFISFFCMHYAIIFIAQGFFVFYTFYSGVISWQTIGIGILSLFLSHLVSYFTNFMGKEEYKRVNATDLFFQPYKRIVFLQLIITAGALGLEILGAPLLGLVLLIVIKITLDWRAHQKEHKNGIGISDWLFAH